MSITPVESFTNSDLVNVFPPSVVLYNPRLGVALNGSPNTPRYATFEFRQSSSMLAMCSSRKPRKVHVRPPSVVFHSPSPCAVLPRMHVSPPPTHTTSGLRESMAMAPMVPPKNRSLIGVHVSPPSVVFITPPPVVPNQYSLGLATDPAAATERPPRSGPTSRQRSPPNTAESSVIGVVGAGGTTRATLRVGGGAGGACWAGRALETRASVSKSGVRTNNLRISDCRLQIADCRTRSGRSARLLKSVNLQS